MNITQSLHKKLILTFIFLISSYTNVITVSDSHASIVRYRQISQERRHQMEQGLTPLHCVRSIEQTTEILRYGPDINAQDNFGRTPLEHMMIDGRYDIAAYLIQQGATMYINTNQHNNNRQ